jgi:hypothetical protein
MSRRKSRNTVVFSISFLDCICCGFGAVLLLFVLTSGRKADINEQGIADLEMLADSLQIDVEEAKKLVADLEKSIKVQTEKVRTVQDADSQADKEITDSKEILNLMLADRSTVEDELSKLLEEKKEIPKVEEKPVIPIPNTQRRQYLTGFNLTGERILFLVEASGGMLDETIDAAIDRMGDPDFKKRESPKWTRTVKAVQWMIATLDPNTKYQVLVFNKNTLPIIPSRDGEWFDPKDTDTTIDVLQRLRALVPTGGANLERAFLSARDFKYAADNIVLFVDGLPTQSEAFQGGFGTVGDKERERMFKDARRRRPPRTPINTILFPMSGDPGAALLYWILANDTKGAMVSPAKSWPDI